MIPPLPKALYVSKLSATNFVTFNINRPSSESITLVLKWSAIHGQIKWIKLNLAFRTLKMTTSLIAIAMFITIFIEYHGN